VAVLAALIGLVLALATGSLGLLAALVAIPLAVADFYSPSTTAVAGGVTLAVTVLAGLRDDAFGAPHMAALIAVALGGLMAVAFAVERRARDRYADFASFLGEAGTLLSSSLDFDATAKAVAAIPVPDLADWCLVELVAADGTVERRAASHPDEGAEQLSAAIATVGKGASGARAELWRELPGALLDSWAAGDAGRLAQMRSVGARGAMRVPLRTPERLLGTMTLLSAASRRRYEELDLHRAEELAARCSLAIENALLYRTARRSGERRFGRRAEPPATTRPAGPQSTTD
jgi:hypothetical protein